MRHPGSEADTAGSPTRAESGVAARAACRIELLGAEESAGRLTQLLDAAVADGVDVISYSVGSSLLRTTAPDDLALLAAARAGVIAVVAAGNEGPGFGSIGSPAGSPAVITVAASTREGESNAEAMEIAAPANLAGRYAVREAFFTPPLADVDPIEASLVHQAADLPLAGLQAASAS